MIEKVVEKLLKNKGVKFTGEKFFSLFKQMGVAVMKVGEESYAYTMNLLILKRKY